MIELRGLSKRFGATTALRDVSVTFPRGKVAGIVGPNAAGKTTLIKTMLGLVHADVGDVLLDGQRVNGEHVNGEASYRSRIGYMPQIARYPDNLTAANLMAFLAELRGGIGHAALDEELVDHFHLRDSLDKPLRALSGGTRQKVNAAVAFLFRPEILILDEPTAGLDPLSSSLLKDKVLAECELGRTVIVTSHVMSELEELADNIVFLLEGCVRFTGTLHDLKEQTRQTTLERAIAHMMIREAAA